MSGNANQIYITGLGTTPGVFVNVQPELTAVDKLDYEQSMAILYASYISNQDTATLQASFNSVNAFNAQFAQFLKDKTEFAAQDAVFDGVLNKFITNLNNYNTSLANYNAKFTTWNFGLGGPHPGNPPIPPETPAIINTLNPGLTGAYNAARTAFIAARTPYLTALEDYARLRIKINEFNTAQADYATQLANYNAAFAAWDYGRGSAGRPSNLPIPPKAGALLLAAQPTLASYNATVDAHLALRTTYLNDLNAYLSSGLTLPEPTQPVLGITATIVTPPPPTPPTLPTLPPTLVASYTGPVAPTFAGVEPTPLERQQAQEYSELVESLRGIIRTLRTTTVGGALVAGLNPIFIPGGSGTNIFGSISEMLDEIRGAALTPGFSTFPTIAESAILRLDNLARGDKLNAQTATSAGVMISTWDAVRSSTLAEQLVNWIDVPKVKNFILEGISAGRRASIAFLDPLNLQDMIHLEYVTRGNNIINSELLGLEQALSINKDLLDTVNQIQELMNLKVPERAKDSTNEFPNFWSFVFDPRGIIDTAGNYIGGGSDDNYMLEWYREAGAASAGAFFPGEGAFNVNTITNNGTPKTFHEATDIKDNGWPGGPWIMWWKIAFWQGTNALSNRGGMRRRNSPGGFNSSQKIALPNVYDDGVGFSRGNVTPRKAFIRALGLEDELLNPYDSDTGPITNLFTTRGTADWKNYPTIETFMGLVYKQFRDHRSQINQALLWEQFVGGEPFVEQGTKNVSGLRSSIRLFVPGQVWPGINMARGSRGDYLDAWHGKLEELEAQRFESDIDGEFDPTPGDPSDLGGVSNPAAVQLIEKREFLFNNLVSLRDRYLDLLNIDAPAGFVENEYDPNVPFTLPASPTAADQAKKSADDAIRENNILKSILEFLPKLDQDRVHERGFSQIPSDDQLTATDFFQADVPNGTSNSNKYDKLAHFVEDRQWLDSENEIKVKGGVNQEILSRLLTAGQNFNDVKRQDVRSASFRMEEFYKSASSVIAKLSQILEKIAQNSGR